MEVPLVRHFVACRKIIGEPGTTDVTLESLIHAIVPSAGEEYPILRPEMALYALLTNGRGIHSFALELTRFDEGDEVLLFRSPEREVHLGQDPVAVLGMPIPLKNFVFETPGQHAFYLVCDGQRIAEEIISLKEER